MSDSAARARDCVLGVICQSDWINTLIANHSDQLTVDQAALVAARVAVTALEEIGVKAFPMAAEVQVASEDLSKIIAAGLGAGSHDHELRTKIHAADGTVLASSEHVVACVMDHILIDFYPLHRGVNRREGFLAMSDVVTCQLSDDDESVQLFIAPKEAAGLPADPDSPVNYAQYAFSGNREFINSDAWRDRENLRPAINALRFALQEALKAGGVTLQEARVPVGEGL